MVEKIAIGFVILFLVACSANDANEQIDSIPEEPEGVQEVDASEDVDDTAAGVEAEDEESSVVEIDLDEELPPLPESFNESADYPIVGEFSRREVPDRSLEGEDEIKEVLNAIPKLDEDATDEEIERVKRYIFSLFKGDLTKVNVPLEQWRSMNFDDPNGESEEIRLKENYNVAILLDASGSVGKLEDGKTRMDLAKESIHQFVEGLPEGANVSLWVHGHVGSGTNQDKEKS